MTWAKECLAVSFDRVTFSRRIWTADHSGSGKMYLNQLATAETQKSAEEVVKLLKDMEAKTGRTKERVTIDLDLMSYDDRKFHLYDWTRDYIRRLTNDLA